jgi:hypothetical protein
MLLLLSQPMDTFEVVLLIFCQELLQLASRELTTTLTFALLFGIR